MEMVRHTLATLGPKVQATRMVRDYVTTLYTPVARSARQIAGDGLAGARELAGWKARVRSGWHGVRVDHVESEGVSDVVNVGDEIRVTAYVNLGDLRPEDVQVQVVGGLVDDNDTLSALRVFPLEHTESYEGGRHAFAGARVLDATGPFGYTVRVVPDNPMLAAPTELGLAASAEH